MPLYFYELHEGPTDLMTDALLVSERDHTPAQFAEMVQAARRAIVDTYEEDTIVEAVARELERSHGFTYLSDEKLRASMSVGATEEDTFLVDIAPEFRSLVAELER
jgi:predicted dinucleotide-utilizing enzyme